MLSKEGFFDYAENFFGYGNFASSLYIIGMEEGGGELEHRVNIWKASGKNHLMDSYSVHQKMPNITKYYTGDIAREKYQPTVSKLLDNIVVPYFKFPGTWKEFQANYFGRILPVDSNYKHCKMELYPVPCKSNFEWEYGEVSGMTKEEFRAKIKDHRVEFIRSKITANKPRAVVMYGGIGNREFDPLWNRIAGTENWDKFWVAPSMCSYFSFARDNTIYAKIAHPCSHVKNPREYYSAVCKKIGSF